MNAVVPMTGRPSASSIRETGSRSSQVPPNDASWVAVGLGAAEEVRDADVLGVTVERVEPAEGVGDELLPEFACEQPVTARPAAATAAMTLIRNGITDTSIR
jgi:hypothetical protein